MIDVRDYKGTVRDAVRRERHCDANWSWKVKAIRKDVAKIGWGYLEYLEESKDFTVYVMENDEIGMCVVGVVPDGHKVVRFVGENRWDDVRTVEDGFASVIHGMAQYAHAT